MRGKVQRADGKKADPWTGLKAVRKGRRTYILDLYSVLTTGEQLKFHKIFGENIGEIPEKNLAGCIDLCKRTIKKNIEKIDSTFIRIK